MRKSLAALCILTGLVLIAMPSIAAEQRNPINLMIVQDASTSFQSAWAQAIDADTALLNNINKVSVTGDKAGMVAFNSALPNTYLQDRGLYFSYAVYPHMNEGIKWTTDSSGMPRKTDNQGNTSATGVVQPMDLPLTSFNTTDHDNLTPALYNASRLLKNGLAWGDTDTAVGLNYAIDQLIAGSIPSADKIIVLISDGRPHDLRDPPSGGFFSAMKQQDALTAAMRAEGYGIKIYTVTLSGTDGADFQFNESLVTNGGLGIRASTPSDVMDSMDTIFHSIIPVPEPSSILSLLFGIGTLGGLALRRRSSCQ